MTLTLYIYTTSVPARACMILTKVLKLDVKFVTIDLFKNEHLNEDFLKINFQHVIPTLVDGDFTLWESRAINTYLVSAYAKDDSLYPKDVKKRAVVDQRLYFDSTLFERLKAVFFPIFFCGVTTIAEDKVNAVKEYLSDLDTFLDGQSFVTGNTFTLADISLVASISTAEATIFDLTQYKNILPWMDRCKKLIPDYEKINQAGTNQLGQLLKSKLGNVK